jgi:hypothetical protein
MYICSMASEQHSAELNTSIVNTAALCHHILCLPLLFKISQVCPLFTRKNTTQISLDHRRVSGHVIHPQHLRVRSETNEANTISNVSYLQRTKFQFTPPNTINMHKRTISYTPSTSNYPLPPQDIVTLIPTAANAGPTFKSTLTVLLLIASS